MSLSFQIHSVLGNHLDSSHSRGATSSNSDYEELSTFKVRRTPSSSPQTKPKLRQTASLPNTVPNGSSSPDRKESKARRCSSPRSHSPRRVASPALSSGEAKSGSSSPSVSRHNEVGHVIGDPITKLILDKHYTGEHSFSAIDFDVDELVNLVEREVDNLYAGGLQKMDKDVQNRAKYKEELIAESRTFVTDSKLLVSSATQSKEKLIENMNNSIHTLARIVHKSQETMAAMETVSHASQLGSKVKDVAKAYKVTVSAAHSAVGKPLSDPNMKQLMRQATTLAAILSSLMKTLKALEVPL